MKDTPFSRTVGHCLASLLCLMLVGLLTVTGLYISLTRLAKPKGVSEIMEQTIRTTDYTQIVLDTIDAPTTLSTVGRQKLTRQQTEIVETLLENEAVCEIIDLYAVDIATAIKGDEAPQQLTPQTIKEIARNNIDQVLDLAEENLEQPINKKKMKKQILRIVDHNAHTLVKALPTTKEVTVYMEKTGVAPTVHKTLDPTVLYLLLAGCGLAAVLLVVCQWRGWNWLLFLGISSGVAAGLLGLSVLFFRSDLLPNIQLKIAKEWTPVVQSASASLERNLFQCLFALLGLALVCGIAFALTHRFCVKSTTVKTTKGGAVDAS